MLIAIVIIGILLSIVTYKMEKNTYVTNVTTIYIVNNTVVNVTSQLNTTEDKPKISLPFLNEDVGVGAKVVS